MNNPVRIKFYNGGEIQTRGNYHAGDPICLITIGKEIIAQVLLYDVESVTVMLEHELPVDIYFREISAHGDVSDVRYFRLGKELNDTRRN